MEVKKGLYYTNEHEWVMVEEDVAFIGISDYAQHSMGELVFIDLPEEGDEFEKGDAFGAVESVKAASDVYMPISGEVLEVNENVSDNPALVNEDAFENWLIKIKPSDLEELGELMNSEQYETFLSEEN
ncbi:MAG: glycine cleavage system protein GcvH [Eubacteriales bacterium]|nr:glycine cleavage system protein GcvH [Eubacteriales bacterium]NCC81349.1 glycine cleavage system protein GcvH [Clostridia bacterium]